MPSSLSVCASLLTVVVLSSCVYVPPPGYYPRAHAVEYYDNGPYYDEPPPPYYRSERRRYHRETRYYERDGRRDRYRDDERYAYERGRDSVRNGGRTRYYEEETEPRRRSLADDPDLLPNGELSPSATQRQSSSSSPKPSGDTGLRKPPSPQSQEKVPFGTRTNNPERVKSPFPPYNELDVAGMKSGSLAKDPTTGKIFKIP